MKLLLLAILFVCCLYYAAGSVGYEKCSDRRWNCQKYVNQGRCESTVPLWKKWMKRNCEKSCGCDWCVDMLDIGKHWRKKQCRGYKKNCKKNKAWRKFMNKNCRKTCGCHQPIIGCGTRGKKATAPKDFLQAFFGTSTRIVGGKDAKLGDYPWQVGLWYSKEVHKTHSDKPLNKPFCGATLIAPNAVITAAHCFLETPNDHTGTDPKKYYLRLGDLKVGKEGGASPGIESKYECVFLGGAGLNARSCGEGNYCCRKGRNDCPSWIADNAAEDQYTCMTVTPVRESSVKVAIKEIHTHPDYVQEEFFNDIAVLILAKPITEFTKNLKPICMPETQVLPNNCWISGWGRTAEDGSTADVLQHVKIPIVPVAKCNRIYEALFYDQTPPVIDQRFRCAGYDQGKKDACQGDSGGPLSCPYHYVKDKRYKRFYLSGVVSFGNGCARAKSYGVYTNVFKYVNWIRSVLKWEFF